MRFLFSCTAFLWLCVTVSNAQQKTIIVYGKLTDAQSNQPVNSAPVYLENTTNKTLTNRLGNYYLKVTPGKGKEFTVMVSDLRYDIVKRKITAGEWGRAKNDSLRIDFRLEYPSLPDVEITDKPDEVYGSKQHHVSDFEFLGDKMLLLVYEKKLDKGGRLLLCDKDMKVLSNMLVPCEPKCFHRDFQGNVELVCTEKVYSITVYDSTMGLVPMERKYFDEYIKPLVDTGNNHVYFSNFTEVYPAFDYFAWNESDSSYKKIRHLIDKPLMDLYRAQYKYVDGRDKLEAYRAELKTGIDKEIWVALWSGFPQSIYYKPLYAPMFLKEDTVLIFDHYSNRLFRYDRNNEVIDSIEINYHLGKTGKEWEEQLVKDYDNNTIYGVFQRGGRYFMKELNTSTGEISRIATLRYKYPENIKVKGGFVYYIYRPFGSVQNKFLYKEKIGN